MADERCLHAPLAKPRLLERQEAQHQIREPAQLGQAPLAPRPHLGRDQVHGPDATRPNGLDHGEVRGGTVDGHMQHHAIGERPLRDFAPHAPHHVDLAQAREPHGPVLSRDADHLGAGLAHAGTAPGSDAHRRILLKQRADHRRGVGIAGRLEGREEDRPGPCAVRGWHGPERSRQAIDRVG